MMLNAGMQLPEQWQNIPELEQGLAWYIDAFSDLSTCRSYGMSAGPIPWSAINRYVTVEEITEEDFPRLIRAMDTVYLEYVKEQN
jgi:hypothetical protein